MSYFLDCHFDVWVKVPRVFLVLGVSIKGTQSCASLSGSWIGLNSICSQFCCNGLCNSQHWKLMLIMPMMMILVPGICNVRFLSASEVLQKWRSASCTQLRPVNCCLSPFFTQDILALQSWDIRILCPNLREKCYLTGSCVMHPTRSP